MSSLTSPLSRTLLTIAHLSISITVFLLVISNYLIEPCSAQSPSQYDPPHKKFEYKYSFKGPYLAQKDGAVPFWEYGGNAIASDDMVRITPSLRSKKGFAWTKYKSNFEWWEVEIWLRVTGRGRLGADGIAFWFTESKTPEGPVFGAADQWRGLGVFFDSFDNDGKGNNPYIMAMLNDGSKIYDHNSDGSSQQIGGCLRDFRNKPFPVRARIEYYNHVLTVFIHSGNTNNEDEYELCLRAENVYLPQYGHFGLSAATGGLADDHDALKFLTHSLHPPGTPGYVTSATVPDSEKQKIDSQYEHFKDKLEKQKEQYFKDHPDEAKKYKELEESNADHEFETLGEKELQQIYDAQNALHDTLKTLNRKLDEIIGRQERTLSIVSSVGMGQVAQGGQIQGQGQGHPPPQIGLPIQRHEVEALLGASREVVQSTRDIRQTVLNQHNTGAQPASAQAGGGTHSLHTQLLTEVRDGINILRKEMAAVGTKMMGSMPPGAQTICPPPPSCVSTGMMATLLSIHLIASIGYLIYKANADKKHGKFY